MNLWAEIDSPSIEKMLKVKEVVIAPIGSTEQHGPHLPTGTDHIIGWEIAKRVAENVDCLLLPIAPFGFSEDHFPRAGTVTLTAETLRNLVRDIAKSLARNGAMHIVLMSGHAGHLAQLADICFDLNVTGVLGETIIHNISPYNSIAIEQLIDILEEEVLLHAEELETSLMLYLRPDLVQMEKAVKEYPPFIPKGLNTPNFFQALNIITSSKFLGRDTKTGICGDATLATKEKGEKLINLMVEAVTEVVRGVTKN